ncbi:hypothetical protein ISS39_10240 [Candidatus Bathyarchaeota archaeon]|nr:hypothetical protein [Candidatus Bathyarchaeota archaeon]
MPDKIRVQLEKWEKSADDLMKKVKRAPKKISVEVREEAAEIAQGGKKLLKSIDQRTDKVEENTKKSLRDLRKRLKKAYEAMSEEISDTAYDGILETLE